MHKLIPMITLFCALVGGVCLLAHHAAADGAAPPASMSLLDAARLHAAQAELLVIQRQCNDSAAPQLKLRKSILDAYRLDERAFAQKGGDSVDFDTGAIKRAQPKTAMADKPSFATAPSPQLQSGGAK